MALRPGQVGIRLTRTLWGRWRSLPAGERERLRDLAESAKEAALEVRGSSDRDSADRDLRTANEHLAAAIVESAESDPEIDAIDVQRLRDDLRRELDRLAQADIHASRGRAPAGGGSGGGSAAR
jgi:hypothetical protein